MIRRMNESAVADSPDWSVYIARCSDGSLYTGIAKDLKARIDAHNMGKGAAYTRSRRPVTLLHSEPGLTRSEALMREAAIKSLPRDRKELLACDRDGLDKKGSSKHNRVAGTKPSVPKTPRRVL
ncbi:MAG: GIY-YIG nuclease family protein [Elusimicrobia bacterium]|nr:GIY-YIG nuclease family protein [Elusimicrobiota bacterium]